MYYLNLVFTIISLLESCVVLGLAYFTGTSLLPSLPSFYPSFLPSLPSLPSLPPSLLPSGRGGKTTTTVRPAEELGGSSGSGGNSGSSGGSNSGGGGNTTGSSAPKYRYNDEGSLAARFLREASGGEEAEGGEGRTPPLQVRTGGGGAGGGGSGGDGKGSGHEGDLASRLLFFENLFFKLDMDGGGECSLTLPSHFSPTPLPPSQPTFPDLLVLALPPFSRPLTTTHLLALLLSPTGSITFEEMRSMLSFTCLSLTSEQRDEHLRAADTSNNSGRWASSEQQQASSHSK